MKQKRIRTPKRGTPSATTQKTTDHLLRLADPDCNEPAVAAVDNRGDTDEPDDFDALYESWVDFQTELALGGRPPEEAG